MSEIKAVLLIGHGSRAKGASQAMQRVADQVKARYGYELLEICHMELQEPSFEEALDSIVARGATRVLVVPYFLHEGMHIKVDIPQLMQKKAQEYPHVAMALGPHLGFDDALAAIVHQRIQQTEDRPDIRSYHVPSEDSLAAGHA